MYRERQEDMTVKKMDMINYMTVKKSCQCQDYMKKKYKPNTTDNLVLYFVNTLVLLGLMWVYSKQPTAVITKEWFI